MECRRKSVPTFGRDRADTGRFRRPTSHLDLGQFRPTSATFGPESPTDIDRFCSESGQVGPKLAACDQTWPAFDKVWPRPNWPGNVKKWPEIDQHARFWPKLAGAAEGHLRWSAPSAAGCARSAAAAPRALNPKPSCDVSCLTTSASTSDRDCPRHSVTLELGANANHPK